MSRLYGAGSGLPVEGGLFQVSKPARSSNLEQIPLNECQPLPAPYKLFPQEMFTNPQYDHVTLGIILLLPRYLGH